jgi:hypothetical protein
VKSTYNSKTGKFISTNGGTWKLTGDTMTEKVEFDSNNSERVSKEVSFDVVINDSILEIVGSKIKFRRIDKGEPVKLQGVWIMSGSLIDGKTQSRDISGPIKTMKILSGKRFQRISYNTETNQVLGAGGGFYSTTNNEYIENTEFFSTDDSKVRQQIKI